MKKELLGGIAAVALAGGAMMAGAGSAGAAETQVSTVSASSISSETAADDCGFNWFGQYFQNCVDHDQLVLAVVNDYVTYESFSEYICVPAGENRVIMPGFAVLYVSVAADSC